MPATAELTRLVSALTAAQTLASSADQVTIAKALDELEGAWVTCPAGSLDAFDVANIHLTRSTLQQLLDRDGSEAIAEALRLGRQFGSDQEDQRLLVQVLLEAGNSARQKSDFEVSRPLLEEAVERARSALGPLHEETARAYNCLGLWGRYRGDLELARQAYTTALRIIEAGTKPQLRADVLHNLASLEHLAGRPTLALELIETTLALRDQTLDGESAERDGDDGVRAAILIDLGRYPESEEIFRSLAVRLGRRWGADSMELMHLNANWAVLEQHQGDLVAARSRYAAAISAAERLTGPGRAEAAVIYANAAHLAYTCGDVDTARSHAHQAVLGLQAWASDDLPSLRLARQVLDALDS